MRRISTTNPSISATPSTSLPTQRTAAPSATGWTGRDILGAPETALVLNSVWSGDPITVVPSPPGAGKTRLVALLSAALSTGPGLRVGVAAQTRAQAIEIAARIGALNSRVILGWAAKGILPAVPGADVVRGHRIRFPSSGGGVLVCTTARWLVSRPHELGCDVMLVDEAWQATYADLGALGAFSAQIACVGDPGQIAPVVTGPVDRWRGLPSGPHLPAPIALAAAHPDVTTTVALPHTWRLGPETTALIQPAFYPDLPFTSRRPPEHIETKSGTALPEWATTAIRVAAGPADPALIQAAASRVTDLLTHRYVTPSEPRQIVPADIAVVAAHVSQAAALRAALSGLPDVLVGTANQLQGLERPAVVALHPLVGATTITDFNTDPGRACVMFSRHRAHLTTIMDSRTPALLAAGDPAHMGTAAHQTLLRAALTT